MPDSTPFNSDLSHLNSVQLNLLKFVGERPGLKRRDLQDLLGLSKYQVHPLIKGLISQHFLTFRNHRNGQAHQFFLSERVSRQTVETEIRRREPAAVDWVAREGIALMRDTFANLAQQLDQLLSKD